jgi:hypothetical protein
MMTKTTLSDGRRTRRRFAAPTPTPPKFLIGTDDPARIGILSDQRESKGFGWDPAKTLRMAEPPEFLIGTDDPARIGILSDQRESKGFGWDPAKTLRMAEPPEFLIGTDDPARIGILSDQRESKGFGWDPAKTLRMAEPPEFLIGTIEQSENHLTPSQQTTYPNPNGHKTRFSLPPSRIADPPQRLANSPQRTRLPHPPMRIADSPQQPPLPLRDSLSGTAASGISRPLPGLPPIVYPERRRPSPASRRAQPHPRNEQSAHARSAEESKTPAGRRRYEVALARRQPRKPLTPLPAVLSYRWPPAGVFQVSPTSRPLSSLAPLAQLHPRNKQNAHARSAVKSKTPAGRRRYKVPFAQPHPRKPLTPLPAVLLYRWPPAGVFQVLPTSRPLSGLAPLAQPHPRKLSGLSRSLDFTPFAQPHLRNAVTPLPALLSYRWPPAGVFQVLPTSRPLSGLVPLAQPHPRKPSGLSQSLGLTPFALPHLRNAVTPLPAVFLYRWPPAGVFEVLPTSRPLSGLVPLAQPHPRNLDVGCSPKKRRGARFPTFCADLPAQRAGHACALCGRVKNAGRMPAVRNSTACLPWVSPGAGASR